MVEQVVQPLVIQVLVTVVLVAEPLPFMEMIVVVVVADTPAVAVADIMANMVMAEVVAHITAALINPILLEYKPEME